MTKELPFFGYNEHNLRDVFVIVGFHACILAWGNTAKPKDLAKACKMLYGVADSMIEERNK